MRPKPRCLTSQLFAPTTTAVMSRKLHSLIQSNEPHIFAQETSLLLGNLIDVLEEIEDARGELLNLISADFSVESQTGLLSIHSLLSFHAVTCLYHKAITHKHILLTYYNTPEIWSFMSNNHNRTGTCTTIFKQILSVQSVTIILLYGKQVSR